MQRIDVIIGSVVFVFVAGWLYLLLEVCWMLGIICLVCVILAVVCGVVLGLLDRKKK